MANIDDKDLIPMQHVATILNISLPTMYKWRREKADFPEPIRFGRRCCVWQKSEILEWKKTNL